MSSLTYAMASVYEFTLSKFGNSQPLCCCSAKQQAIDPHHHPPPQPKPASGPDQYHIKFLLFGLYGQMLHSMDGQLGLDHPLFPFPVPN